MTLQKVMGQFTAGEIAFNQVLAHVRQHRPAVRRPSSSREVYERAEEMPGENDTFWIDAAYFDRAITPAQYNRIFQAISAVGVSDTNQEKQ